VDEAVCIRHWLTKHRQIQGPITESEKESSIKQLRLRNSNPLFWWRIFTESGLTHFPTQDPKQRFAGPTPKAFYPLCGNRIISQNGALPGSNRRISEHFGSKTPAQQGLSGRQSGILWPVDGWQQPDR
jgi:hypothetical protein